jgi:hypothetical protein
MPDLNEYKLRPTWPDKPDGYVFRNDEHDVGRVYRGTFANSSVWSRTIYSTKKQPPGMPNAGLADDLENAAVRRSSQGAAVGRRQQGREGSNHERGPPKRKFEPKELNDGRNQSNRRTGQAHRPAWLAEPAVRPLEKTRNAEDENGTASH